MKRLTLDDNRDAAWACLRVYLGLALVIRGYVYLTHGGALIDLMTTHDVPLASATLAELVAVIHIAGGLMLSFGLMTRIAALIQIPNVLGAIVFVHSKEGVFGSDQSAMLAGLVLAVLAVFGVNGSGSWSVDGAFRGVGLERRSAGA